jgi:hypothetical protein
MCLKQVIVDWVTTSIRQLVVVVVVVVVVGDCGEGGSKQLLSNKKGAKDAPFNKRIKYTIGKHMHIHTL